MRNNSSMTQLRGGMIGIRSLSALVTVALIAGCSSEGSKTPAAGEEKKQPVTLKLYTKTNFPSPEDYEKYIGASVKKRFPHVTIDVIRNEKGSTITELVSAGQIPDFIFEGLTNIQDLQLLKLPIDLDPFVQKQKFDLNRINPTVVKSIRSYSDQGQLIYIPFRVFSFANHYNKAIFDKFGVGYPKNGITWEEAIELGKRVTRIENDVQYRGLHAGISVNRIQTQLMLPFVDAKTGKSIMTTDGWKKLFDTFYQIYMIPGNYPAGSTLSDGRTAYLQKRNLAMFPHLMLLGDTDFADAAKTGLEWGISTYPEFKDKPGQAPGVFSDGFVIPQGGKHQDLVFEIISYLLSDEAQIAAGKAGNMTPLVSMDVKKKLYEDNPLAKGIDFTPIWNQKLADPYVRTPYDSKAMSSATKYIQEYYTGKMDLNTAFRQMEEEVNKMVESEKQK